LKNDLFNSISSELTSNQEAQKLLQWPKEHRKLCSNLKLVVETVSMCCAVQSFLPELICIIIQQISHCLKSSVKYGILRTPLDVTQVDERSTKEQPTKRTHN